MCKPATGTLALRTPTHQPASPWANSAPHDRYFRESFARLEVARDFLRQTLPAALLAEIDLTTLEISKDTYVGEDVSENGSDLVYRIAC